MTHNTQLEQSEWANSHQESERKESREETECRKIFGALTHEHGNRCSRCLHTNRRDTWSEDVARGRRWWCRKVKEKERATPNILLYEFRNFRSCCLFRDIEIFLHYTLPKQQTAVENVSVFGNGTKTWIWTNIFHAHTQTHTHIKGKNIDLTKTNFKYAISFCIQFSEKCPFANTK